MKTRTQILFFLMICLCSYSTTTEAQNQIKEEEDKATFTQIKPADFGFDLGINIGTYTGDISEYVYNYRNFFSLSGKFRIWRFYISGNVSGAGRTNQITKIDFYGDDIEGEFKGNKFGGIVRLGFLAYSTPFFEIIPNAGYFGTIHTISTAVQQVKETLSDIIIEGYSAGIELNTPIFLRRKYPEKVPWLCLSTRYDFLIGIKEGIQDENIAQAIKDQFFKGKGHQFSIGVAFLFEY